MFNLDVTFLEFEPNQFFLNILKNKASYLGFINYSVSIDDVATNGLNLSQVEEKMKMLLRFTQKTRL